MAESISDGPELFSTTDFCLPQRHTNLTNPEPFTACFSDKLRSEFHAGGPKDKLIECGFIYPSDPTVEVMNGDTEF